MLSTRLQLEQKIHWRAIIENSRAITIDNAPQNHIIVIINAF